MSVRAVLYNIAKQKAAEWRFLGLPSIADGVMIAADKLDASFRPPAAKSRKNGEMS